MAISEQRLTLEAFLALPEEKPALEYEHGRVTQKVAAKGRHAGIQFDFATLINTFVRPTKIARVFTELRATFGGFSRVPDLAVYLWDRVPRDAIGRVADEFFIPPDIAVEIASPGQTVSYLTGRCAWYVQNGVRISLLINPADDSVLLFQPGKPLMRLQGSDRIDLDAVLPGFGLRAHEIFDMLSME